MPESAWWLFSIGATPIMFYGASTTMRALAARFPGVAVSYYKTTASASTGPARWVQLDAAVVETGDAHGPAWLEGVT